MHLRVEGGGGNFPGEGAEGGWGSGAICPFMKLGTASVRQRGHPIHRLEAGGNNGSGRQSNLTEAD